MITMLLLTEMALSSSATMSGQAWPASEAPIGLTVLVTTSPHDIEQSRRERDRAVLEAVATYLVTTPGGLGEPLDSAKRTVVLDGTPPQESPPFLCFDNCGSDRHRFSASEVHALSQRNKYVNLRGAWLAVCSPCSKTLLIVPDLEKVLSKAADDPSLGKDRLMATWWVTNFEGVFPRAKGWIQAFLPAYSVDGSEAVFLGRIGPSPHGSVVAAHLHLKDSAWVLDWCDIANFV
jgi:hypothetical protein